MLRTVVDSIVIPAHETLAREASELEAAAARFAEAPDPASLAALRSQWLDAERAWKGVELYQFEGLLLVHNAIEKRPPRVEFIEDAIARIAAGEIDASDPDFVESLGATTKGLGSIEYLVFPAGGATVDGTDPTIEAFSDPARGAFLSALAEDLMRKSTELVLFWTPEGDDYGREFWANDSDGADIRGSVSMLANRLIELYETTMQARLGMPLGRTTDGVPRPEEVESPRSNQSMALLTASLESVRATFAAGIDDYLDYLERTDGPESLASRIHEQFDRVLESLDAIDLPLRDAMLERTDQLASAYEEMRALLVLLKTDMAARLGITVTFSDSDGD